MKEMPMQLKAMGIQLMMITGDSKPVAKWVADELNLDDYFAEVLPDKKADKVKEVQQPKDIILIIDAISRKPTALSSPWSSLSENKRPS